MSTPRRWFNVEIKMFEQEIYRKWKDGRIWKERRMRRETRFIFGMNMKILWDSLETHNSQVDFAYEKEEKFLIFVSLLLIIFKWDSSCETLRAIKMKKKSIKSTNNVNFLHEACK